MAFGFGSTFGAGSTDAIASGLTTHATQRTWAIAFSRNGAGGNSSGRLFDKNTGGTQTESLIWSNSATSIRFERFFNSGSGSVRWDFSLTATSQAYRLVIKLDSSANANNMTGFANGSSSTATRSTSGTLNNTAVTNSDPYCFGNRLQDSARAWDGLIWDIAVWDELVPDDICLAISAGYSPLFHRSNLIYYNPLIRDAVDLVGARSQSVTGAAVQPHGRVIFPSANFLSSKVSDFPASTRYLTLASGVQRWVEAIATSAGMADANKIPRTGNDGLLDLSLVKGGINAFQIANGGSRLKSSSNRILIRNSADDGFDAIAASSLLIGTGGEKRISIQSAAPSSPTVGDQWYETNAGGDLKYGWAWQWDGVYWVSPQREWNISTDANALSVLTEFVLPLASTFNYYLHNYFATTYSASVAQDGTNFWRLAIARWTGTTSTTIINSMVTTGSAANTYVRRALTGINTHVDVSGTGATILGFQIIPNGSPGSLAMGGTLTYSLVRPSDLPAYTASQSSTFGGLTGTYANLNDSSGTTGAATNASTEWIKASFSSAQLINGVTVGGGTLSGWGGVASFLNTAVIQSSTDDSSWTTRATISGVADSGSSQFVRFAIGGVSARYWRISKSGYLATTEFRFD